MIIKDSCLPEVLHIEQFQHHDDRGSFIKIFHADTFQKAGIDFNLKESFYSTSKKNVLRGMHYHTAPYHHAKIVMCTAGEILDVVVDVRRESSSFGKYTSLLLSAKDANALYIPAGFAHGFLTLSDNATTFYLQDGMYSALHDAGIRYDSFGFNWPCEHVICSDRDANFTHLNEIS
jgi:dTDP-4-dehydrorhamnose 3,5-epimerase